MTIDKVYGTNLGIVYDLVKSIHQEYHGRIPRKVHEILQRVTIRYELSDVSIMELIQILRIVNKCEFYEMPITVENVKKWMNNCHGNGRLQKSEEILLIRLTSFSKDLLENDIDSRFLPIGARRFYVTCLITGSSIFSLFSTLDDIFKIHDEKETLNENVENNLCREFATTVYKNWIDDLVITDPVTNSWVTKFSYINSSNENPFSINRFYTDTDKDICFIGKELEDIDKGMREIAKDNEGDVYVEISCFTSFFTYATLYLYLKDRSMIIDHEDHSNLLCTTNCFERWYSIIGSIDGFQESIIEYEELSKKFISFEANGVEFSPLHQFMFLPQGVKTHYTLRIPLTGFSNSYVYPNFSAYVGEFTEKGYSYNHELDMLCNFVKKCNDLYLSYKK